MSKLTHEELITRLNYDPETGVFTWLERTIESFATGKRQSQAAR